MIEDRRVADDDRGQTVLDYALAAGVFIIAVVFVLGFIPGMFAPFTGGDTAQVADRYAATLGAGGLGDPASPYVLNETCTAGFFEQMQTGTDAPATCRFDTTADDLDGVFGAGPAIDVNVTVIDLDGDTASLPTGGGSTVSLQAGESVPTGRTVTTARRTVSLAGGSRRLLVRVW